MLRIMMEHDPNMVFGWLRIKFDQIKITWRPNVG